MKSRLLVFFSLTIFIFSCGRVSDNHKASPDISNEDSARIVYPEFNWDTLKGNYFGDFGGSTIRLTINYVSNKQVVGYNIYKGLMRNISGHVEETMEELVLNMAEPGDNPYDGNFKLSVNRETLKFSCIWEPLDTKLKAKTFTLTKLKKLDYDDFNHKDPITNDNFKFFYDHVADTVADVYFEHDGLVRYEYYPNTGNPDGRSEQLSVIKGDWIVKEGKLFIDWEENPIFSKRKSSFKMVKESEYENLLIGDGREFWTQFMP